MDMMAQMRLSNVSKDRRKPLVNPELQEKDRLS